jgi:hypothetical protein
VIRPGARRAHQRLDATALRSILATMTVGEYAGVPLQDPDDTWQHGAVFLLRKPPFWPESQTIGEWTTSVVANVPVVVTRGPVKARNFEDTFAAALTAANRGLDFLSVTGRGDCAIRDPSDDCLVWWPDKQRGGIVMRYRVIQNAELPARADITATVTNPDGTVAPPPQPQTPMAREAYRFIRMARTSDDLYDSYRNMFLAFECLLSDIHPPGQENEMEWFKAALKEAHGLVRLDILAKPGKHTNHVKWVMKHMYERERCALMHAKQNRGKGYLLPQDHIPRAELMDSLGRLWSYIRNLIREQYGVHGSMVDFSAYAMEPGAMNVLRNSVVVISDDETPVVKTPGGGTPIADGSRLVELQSGEAAADPHQRRVWTFLAHCDPSDLSVLTAIRKVCAKLGDDRAQSASELLGPLHLGESVVGFEVVYGVRYVNPAIAPSQFSS